MAEQTTDFELWLDESAPLDIDETCKLMKALLLPTALLPPKNSNDVSPYESWTSDGIIFVRRNDLESGDIVLVLKSKEAVSDFFAVANKKYGTSEEERQELLISYPNLRELENL